jgi:hypothetical protein
MIPYRLMLSVFIVSAVAYIVIGFATFSVPMSLELAEACGFTSADFNAAGHIDYPPMQAWLVSFIRKQEYWSAACVGLSSAFISFSLSAAKRVGTVFASSAAIGGGMLAFVAVCLGCLAPALSVVGLGMASIALAGVPKGLMALNTLLLTSWGTLFLSRRLAVCPVLPK